MSCGSNCCGTADFFGDRIARRHLRKYRRGGPFGTTKRLLAALRETPGPKDSLLDVGGGVGMIAHEMLAAGASSAAIVDASPAFLDAARAESERRHTSDRLRLQLGDAVELRDDVPQADVVTLDKVVCCNADLPLLLGDVVLRARRMIGLIYPRDRWWNAIAAKALAAFGWLTRDSTRWYLHSDEEVDGFLRRAGFERHEVSRTIIWQVALYVRPAGQVSVSTPSSP